MQNDFQAETSSAASPLVLPEAGFVLAHLAELYPFLHLGKTTALTSTVAMGIWNTGQFVKDTVTQITKWSITPY